MTSQKKHDPARAVEQLREAVDELHHFIRELPEAALVEKAWGPKEVLAHLVFWIESYVVQIEAILAGEPPVPPQGRFDDINVEVVEASRGVPVDELLRRHLMASERLCAFVQTLDPERIMLELTKGAVLRPLIWFVSAEAGHIRVHHRMLVQQAQRDPTGEAEKLRKAVDDFCCFIGDLPQAELVEQAGGPKEVLAHLVICHEICVAQIEAILAQEPFRLPQGNDLTTQVVEASRRMSVEDLVRRFQVADERLRDFGQTLDSQNILLEVWRLEMKRGSTRRTLDEVISWLATQIRSRHRKLVREMKRRSPTVRPVSG